MSIFFKITLLIPYHWKHRNDFESITIKENDEIKNHSSTLDKYEGREDEIPNYMMVPNHKGTIIEIPMGWTLTDEDFDSIDSISLDDLDLGYDEVQYNDDLEDELSNDDVDNYEFVKNFLIHLNDSKDEKTQTLLKSYNTRWSKTES